MKVISIKKEKDVFEVELKPNFMERLFGAVNKTEKYKKDPYQTFTYGNGGVYYNEKGKELRNKHYIQIALDEYERSLKFKDERHN